MNTSTSLYITLFVSLFFWVLGWYFGSNIPVFNAQINKTTSSTRSLQDLQYSLTSTIQQVSPSVVSIIATQDISNFETDPWWLFKNPFWAQDNRVVWWSGFFVSSDGVVITSNHVVKNDSLEYTAISYSGETYPLTVITRDVWKDIAFLRINDRTKNNFVPLIVASSPKTTTWQFAIAIGNTLWTFQNSVSFGIISGTNRSIHNDYMNVDWLLQTDAAIHPWNSGWPLLNIDGEVIGVNTMILNAEYDIWFAIPLSQEYIDTNISSPKKGL